jgi:hypothetical protein
MLFILCARYMFAALTYQILWYYATLDEGAGGRLVEIFASDFGPTNPAITPGTFASGAAPATVTRDPSDVLYAGAARRCRGSQREFRATASERPDHDLSPERREAQSRPADGRA